MSPGPAESDQDVDPKSGRGGEGSVRRQPDGCQNRQNLALENLVKKRFLFFGQLLRSQTTDGGFLEPGLEFFETTVLICDHGPGQAPDLLELSRGFETGDIRLVPALLDELSQTAHTDHEKLVQVRPGDGQKFQPFERRKRGIERFFENAPVEGQPAHFPIEEGFRIKRHRISLPGPSGPPEGRFSCRRLPRRADPSP